METVRMKRSYTQGDERYPLLDSNYNWGLTDAQFKAKFSKSKSPYARFSLKGSNTFLRGEYVGKTFSEVWRRDKGYFKMIRAYHQKGTLGKSLMKFMEENGVY